MDRDDRVTRRHARFSLSVKVFFRELELWYDVENISHSGFLLSEVFENEAKNFTVRVKCEGNTFPHVMKARRIREMDAKMAFIFSFFDKSSSDEFVAWLNEEAISSIKGSLSSE